MFEELFLKFKSLVCFVMVGFLGYLVLVLFKFILNFKYYLIK